MGKIAFVFAGQGAQYSGMGQSLCEASPAAKACLLYTSEHPAWARHSAAPKAREAKRLMGRIFMGASFPGGRLPSRWFQNAVKNRFPIIIAQFPAKITTQSGRQQSLKQGRCV